jgi:hypothetical protein
VAGGLKRTQFLRMALFIIAGGGKGLLSVPGNKLVLNDHGDLKYTGAEFLGV